MNSHPNPHPATIARAAFAGMSLRDLAPQLFDMLADKDWGPACQDDGRLRDLLVRMQDDPAIAAAPPPPGIALLAAAYADFRHFRHDWAARLDEADTHALDATPDEWLRLCLRLRQLASAQQGRMFADYRLEGDRFHIS
jgi:hypothetical protein